MKPTLNQIIISLILAVEGCIAFWFIITGDQEWVLNWIGALLAYPSLAILIDQYNKTDYYKTFPEILKRILFISFNAAGFGIVIGISYQLLGKWNLNIMISYWLIILLLHLITIVTLATLIFVNRNDKNYGFLYKFIIILNIFLTLGPVLCPIVLTIIRNIIMNSIAGI
ncbi:DUF3902 family protein [Bacillus thuringiensis]|uniref:DUF3902 family protein n=1 Tax=Bacillus thuringiensis TaxID=1428 RepID=UPI000CF90DED|nr:DUF3902 family protein [Bacillus thuringiensis]PQQ47412.1 hypothetical protein C6A34_12340 [Bacillus thuringiensis]